MLNIIVNPTAGKHKAAKAIQKISQHLTDAEVEYIVHYTEYPGHASILAEQLSSQPCTVIAVGGDGTISEVLSGIKQFDNINLGIIPCGTGNDFAKFINLPKDPIAALELILSGTARFTDFIQAGDKRNLNVAGMGMDVTVLERCRKMKFFKGKLQYFIGLIITLLRFKWYNYTVTLDGQPPMQITGMIAAVCNGKYFGGGLTISPDSVVDDGKLNLILIHKVKKRRIPFALISLLKGKLLKYDFTQNLLCEKVSIIPLKPEKHNLDGELHSGNGLDCHIVSSQLKIFRP